MKFWEAVEVARKTGKKIRHSESGSAIAEWRDEGGRLYWEGTGVALHVAISFIDAEWHIVEPPPKEYSFMEAFAMMEQGKWMQPVYPSLCPVTKIGNGNWSWRKSDGSVESFGYRPFEECHIKCKWIEAK